MKTPRNVAAWLPALMAAASVSCGESSSPTDQREAKQLLHSAIDAVHTEGRVQFELQFEIDGHGSEPRADTLDASADVSGNYEARGRIALSGRAQFFGGDFNGRYLSDRQLGSYAYDATNEQWYGQPRLFEIDAPEEEVRQLISNVLLNGYPATLDDRRSFAEPLRALAKRVIELYGGSAVELSIDGVTLPDGEEASAITFAPQAGEIANIVRERGTNDPQLQRALDAILPKLRPRFVIGNSDLPQELSLAATLDEGLEELGLEGVDSVDIALSLRLSDWGERFDLEPPKRFKPLFEFEPFGSPFD